MYNISSGDLQSYLYHNKFNGLSNELFNTVSLCDITE